jgi:hypothetical protein
MFRHGKNTIQGKTIASRGNKPEKDEFPASGGLGSTSSLLVRNPLEGAVDGTHEVEAD